MQASAESLLAPRPPFPTPFNVSRAGEGTKQQAVVALAFGGYTPQTLGRTAELLASSAYGPILRPFLLEGAEICSQALGRRIDLVARVSQGIETELADYGEAISLVVSTQLAQLRMLEQVHGIDRRQIRFSFGYSLGEVTALIFSGVFKIEEVLPPLLSLAEDCLALARDIRVGLLIFRNQARVAKTAALCRAISREGHGQIALSAHLSPNAVMLMGQNSTLDVFNVRMSRALGPGVRLRRLTDRWPPLHTPLMHQREIAAKVAENLAAATGGTTAPKPPVLSLVTGKFSYGRRNSREMLSAWVDQPQRLSDGLCLALARGVETLVHVGPRPEPIRTTFTHLSSAVADQNFPGLGSRSIARLAAHPWVARLPFSRSALLRAASVSQVVLEDWLLENQPFSSRPCAAFPPISMASLATQNTCP